MGVVTVINSYECYSDEHGENLSYWILLEIDEFGALCRVVWETPTGEKRGSSKDTGYAPSTY
jgi:hypothetical protein